MSNDRYANIHQALAMGPTPPNFAACIALLAAIIIIIATHY